MEVRAAVAEVEPTTGAVVHAFTAGTMVQVFLLAGSVPAESWNGVGQANSLENGGSTMLVLLRKRNESVVVGDINRTAPTLEVTVLELTRSKVILGFEASEDVLVHRREVWERILATSGPGVVRSTRRGKGPLSFGRRLAAV